MTQKKYFEIAVFAPLTQTYTYSFAGNLSAGQRVYIPFGKRKITGVCVAEITDYKEEIKLREIIEPIDKNPIYSKTMLDLARWLSHYYIHPLGEVLKAMSPKASIKSKEVFIELGPQGAQKIAEGGEIGELLTGLFKRKKKLRKATVSKKTKEYGSLESFYNKGFLAPIFSTEPLIRQNTQQQETEPSLENDTQPIKLNDEQQKVVEFAWHHYRTHDLRPILIHGVTGSGKTEVYLSIIEYILAEYPENQALFLLPEIALTPQMAQRVEKKFPGLVSVIHSALPEQEKAEETNKIRSGKTKVLLGARSAVFAPFKNLKVIVVDEEHDPSYKQASGFTYNGRDTAIVRAKMEKALVVLGSATPQIETYWNACNKKYHLVELKNRIGTSKLPEVSLLLLKLDKALPQASLELGQDIDLGLSMEGTMLTKLQDNLEKREQSIVIINRRGYAYYLLDTLEKKPVQCPYCSISMTIHFGFRLLICHYCEFKQKVHEVIKASPDKKFVAIGYGSQKVEELLKEALPKARIARLDSDISTDRQELHNIIHEFKKGEVDILVGTQMLAKGHDFPKVTLIFILNIDSLLDFPDFRAGERVFQLLVQAAGRAGRGELSGRVFIQTLRENHPILNAALAQDYAIFYSAELHFRQRFVYPPFCKLIHVVLSGPELKELDAFAQELHDFFMQKLSEESEEQKRFLKIVGPKTPMIEKIRGKYRRSFLLYDKNHELTNKLLINAKTHFRKKMPRGGKFLIDVDPQSLL